MACPHHGEWVIVVTPATAEPPNWPRLPGLKSARALQFPNNRFDAGAFVPVGDSNRPAELTWTTPSFHARANANAAALPMVEPAGFGAASRPCR